MNYQRFLNAVTKEMQEVVADDESVSLYTILKNNDIKMKAMSIRREGQEVCPMIYMAPFYRMHLAGRTMGDIVNELKNLYQMDANGVTDVRIFFSFQAAKERLAFRIIRYESNTELLKQVPHRRLLDFAVIYYLSMEGKDGVRGSALVYNDHIKNWKVTEEELYEAAVSNMKQILPAYTESLEHVLEGLILPQSGKIGPQGIYIVSNIYNFYGAAAVFYQGVLAEISTIHGCDLYLLPSSVHEFLALPAVSDMDEDELRALVKNVNMTHVAPEDVLSDNIYRYLQKEDRIIAL